MSDEAVDERIEEEALVDGPAGSSDIRLQSPVRRSATKRGSRIHEDEPDTKKTIWDDGEDANVKSEDSEELLILKAKEEDRIIIFNAVLGRNLTEIYSNSRIKLAVDRETVNQLLSTDIMEVFSPERVTATCEKYGLKPGQAMDIKSGFDLDLAKDRKRCWEEIIREEPKLIIGSPPCTFSRGCKS